jgi:hypothetical protein
VRAGGGEVRDPLGALFGTGIGPLGCAAAVSPMSSASAAAAVSSSRVRSCVIALAFSSSRAVNRASWASSASSRASTSVSALFEGVPTGCACWPEEVLTSGTK